MCLRACAECPTVPVSPGTEPEADGAATSHQGPSNYLPNWAPESHKSRNRLSMPGWPLGRQVWFLHSESISRVKGSAIYTFSHDHRDKRRLGLDRGADFMIQEMKIKMIQGIKDEGGFHDTIPDTKIFLQKDMRYKNFLKI